MPLNPDKTFIISYTRKTHKILFDYKIGDTSIKRVNKIRDLGVIMDNKLQFTDHRQNIRSDCLRRLYGILNISKTFKSPRVFLNLYRAVVPAKLEYGILIWSGCCQSGIVEIERIQRKFIKYFYNMFDKKGIYKYDVIMKRLNLMTINNRAKYFDIMFLYNMVNNNIDCMELTPNILVRASKINTRNRNIFYVNTKERLNPIKRILNTYNNLLPDIDVYGTYRVKFKKELKNYLLESVS